MPLPVFAALTPGYEIKEAERRQTRSQRPHQRVRRASSGTRSPPGVPPRHLRQRPNATAQLQLRASWDGTSQERALSAPCHPQCSGLPRGPVIVPAGRFYPEPPGSGSDEPPPAGTALAPPAGVAGWRPLRERDGTNVTIAGTIVKFTSPLPGRPFCTSCGLLRRHGRTCSGHPRLPRRAGEDVSAGDKRGHDEGMPSVLE
jgi:hypothetical protein